VHNVNGQHIGESDYLFSVTARLPTKPLPFKTGYIGQSMLKLPTHSGIYDLFLNYSTWNISSPVAVALLYHVMQLTWFL
jgi:hypothetical protein